MDTTQVIGLIGLPGLVQPLEAAGLTVVGGGQDFKQAVPPIREARSSFGFIPILVADSATPGLNSWLELQAGSGCAILLAYPEGAEPAITTQVAKRISLPRSLTDLVAALGFNTDGVPPNMREAYVDLHGNVNWPDLEVSVQTEGTPEEPQQGVAVDDDFSGFTQPAEAAPDLLVGFDDTDSGLGKQSTPPAQSQPVQPAPMPHPQAPTPSAVSQERPPEEPAQPHNPSGQSSSPVVPPVEPAVRPAADPAWEGRNESTAAEDAWAPAPQQPQAQAGPPPSAPPTHYQQAPPTQQPQQWSQPQSQPSTPPREQSQQWSQPKPQHGTPHYTQQPQAQAGPPPSAPPTHYQQAPATQQPWSQPQAQQGTPHYAQPQAPTGPPPSAPPSHYQQAPPTQQPQQWSQRPPQSAGQVDTDAMFGAPASADEMFAATGSNPGGSGGVIVSLAGRGGAGKTTTAGTVAQSLAVAGYKVILIDSSTQDSQRIVIGLPEPQRTAYDSVIRKDIRAGLLTPSDIRELRPRQPDDVGYALLAAAPKHAGVVTPEHYLDLVDQARRLADWVVVDTQIIDVENVPNEQLINFPMIADFLIPLVRDSSTWVVGLSDGTKDGIVGLFRALMLFKNAGVLNSSRCLAVFNKITRDTPLNEVSVEQSLKPFGRFIGSIGRDNRIEQAMNHGQTVADNPVLRPVIDAVLKHITNNPKFDAHERLMHQRSTPDTGGGTKQKKGWRSWFGRKK